MDDLPKFHFALLPLPAIQAYTLQTAGGRLTLYSKERLKMGWLQETAADFRRQLAVRLLRQGDLDQRVFAIHGGVHLVIAAHADQFCLKYC
jgi:hypothetical protein